VSLVQLKHEEGSLLHGLVFLRDLGPRDIDVFGDSNLIVQQVRGIANVQMECSILTGIDA
jgi:ribonuclease HI